MINAGYEIIEEVKLTKATYKGYVIGKAISPKEPEQWVTWYFVVRDNGQYVFYYGNYFNSERKAYKDFYRRLMEEYDF